MSTMKEENKKKSNVPNLRFPEFEGEWKKKKLGDIANITGGGTPNTDIEEYWNGEIHWFTPSEIKSAYVDKSVRTITELGLVKSSAKLLPAGAILLTTRATIGEVAIAQKECCTNQGFQSLVVNDGINNIFIANWIKQNKNELTKRAKGSTFAEISKSEVEKIPLVIPNTDEQNKIAKFLTLLDERIATQNKIIEDLKLLKNTIRHTLFTQLEKSDTETKLIKDVLDYEQPLKYIVGNTEYQNNSVLTPVLTANKAFILGYTSEKNNIYGKGECIIFDDFTMDLKYVDFPFKIKSSAIKILTPKSRIILKYIYEYLCFLNLVSNDHKRHYISEVESISIYVPLIGMQNTFSNLLSALDKKIQGESYYLNLLLSQKYYLLRHIFV